MSTQIILRPDLEPNVLHCIHIRDWQTGPLFHSLLLFQEANGRTVYLAASAPKADLATPSQAAKGDLSNVNLHAPNHTLRELTRRTCCFLIHLLFGQLCCAKPPKRSGREAMQLQAFLTILLCLTSETHWLQAQMQLQDAEPLWNSKTLD